MVIFTIINLNLLIMKNYKLVEKAVGNVKPIIYRIENDNGRFTIYQDSSYLSFNEPFCIGCDIKENNRGWTINTAILTGEFKDIFLPRARFEKIEE